MAEACKDWIPPNFATKFSMPPEDFPGPMKLGMRKCFETGEYSDLTVQCKNGDTYKTHKLVLCNQSHVFKNACNPEHNFKEANEGIIQLKDDEPEIIKALLEFLYCFDYTVPESADMLFHVQIYAIGDLYGVNGIKDLAKRRFKKLAWTSWGCPTFPDAIQAIYNNTPEEDRGLRDVAVEIAAAQIEELLEKDGYRTMMDEVGPFGKDLARALFQFPSEKAKELKDIAARYGKYRCPGRCGQMIEMVLPTDLSVLRCLRCGGSYNSSSWSSNKT